MQHVNCCELNSWLDTIDFIRWSTTLQQGRTFQSVHKVRGIMIPKLWGDTEKENTYWTRGHDELQNNVISPQRTSVVIYSSLMYFMRATPHRLSISSEKKSIEHLHLVLRWRCRYFKEHFMWQDLNFTKKSNTIETGPVCWWSTLVIQSFDWLYFQWKTCSHDPTTKLKRESFKPTSNHNIIRHTPISHKERDTATTTNMLNLKWASRKANAMTWNCLQWYNSCL